MKDELSCSRAALLPPGPHTSNNRVGRGGRGGGGGGYSDAGTKKAIALTSIFRTIVFFL